jgi:hypothetical protein
LSLLLQAKKDKKAAEEPEPVVESKKDKKDKKRKVEDAKEETPKKDKKVSGCAEVLSGSFAICRSNRDYLVIKFHTNNVCKN